jgi:hypothetical protein
MEIKNCAQVLKMFPLMDLKWGFRIGATNIDKGQKNNDGKANKI